MTMFDRGSDSLGRLRDAAAGLKGWRPAGPSKLRVAREQIERLTGPIRLRPERPSPAGRLQDPPGAGRRSATGPAADDPVRPARPGTASGVRTVRGVPPAGARPGPVNRAGTRERLPRRLERLFPRLRTPLRKIDRLALAARPGLLEARRTYLRHRRKLIWIFVAGASLMVAPFA